MHFGDGEFLVPRFQDQAKSPFAMQYSGARAVKKKWAPPNKTEAQSQGGGVQGEVKAEAGNRGRLLVLMGRHTA
jgi:hypothetical protein